MARATKTPMKSMKRFAAGNAPPTPRAMRQSTSGVVFLFFLQCFLFARVVGRFLCSSSHILDIVGLLEIVWRSSSADNSATCAMFPSSVSPLSPSFVGSGRETVVRDTAQFAESLLPASSPQIWSSQAVCCLNLSACWGIIIGYWNCSLL